MANITLLSIRGLTTSKVSIFGRRSYTVGKPLFSNAPQFNQPADPNGRLGIPRFGGPITMMRLPYQSIRATEKMKKLDACFFGIPLDWGTSNRSGTRFGPRQIRCESALLRPYNTSTGAAPFESLQVADVGDVPLNPYSLLKSVKAIEVFVKSVTKYGCRPLALGGDHTLTLPVLRALAKCHGPMALIHIDAHSDTSDKMHEETIAHGTPFRRAQEEGLLIAEKSVQIGLRGGGYTPHDYQWAKDKGFRLVPATECWHKSLVPLMKEMRITIGNKQPVYISFDIDGLDPAYAPGTGTPEIAGLTPAQGLEIVRGCRGLNVVGGDLVEVSPPYDMAGTTALTGANLLFEMLCVLPDVKYY